MIFREQEGRILMNNEKKTIEVLYQSDDGYAIYMGVSIKSLLENNQQHNIIVHILDLGISDINKEDIQKIVKKYNQKIVFYSTIELKNEIKNSPIAKYSGFRRNKASYCKMFLDCIFPVSIEKILYIDCDTIVEGDIGIIMDIDMKGNPIGMVQDAQVTERFKKSIGFKKNDRYYNSGVILFDMEQWRKKRCRERINKHAMQGYVYGTVDQDYFNVVLKQEIYTLDISMNFQGLYYAYGIKNFEHVFKHEKNYYTEDEIQEAFKSPIIVHFLRFCGESPWNKNTVHPCKQNYEKYLDQSDWRQYKIELTKNSGYIFKVERAMYRVLPRFLFCRIFKCVHDIMLVKSNRAT
ncbi:MAG: glycosyltransferase family 8 protein [Bacteroides sp.]|nr:glycosyltransferase family 8 protein [Bacteroides sp.]